MQKFIRDTYIPVWKWNTQWDADIRGFLLAWKMCLDREFWEPTGIVHTETENHDIQVTISVWSCHRNRHKWSAIFRIVKIKRTVQVCPTSHGEQYSAARTRKINLRELKAINTSLQARGWYTHMYCLANRHPTPAKATVKTNAPHRKHAAALVDKIPNRGAWNWFLSLSLSKQNKQINISMDGHFWILHLFWINLSTLMTICAIGIIFRNTRSPVWSSYHFDLNANGLDTRGDCC